MTLRYGREVGIGIRVFSVEGLIVRLDFASAVQPW